MDSDDDSTVEILADEASQIRVVAEETNLTEKVGEARVSRAVSCSTPVKSSKGGGHESMSLVMIPVRKLVKRTSKVVFAVDERDINPIDGV